MRLGGIERTGFQPRRSQQGPLPGEQRPESHALVAAHPTRSPAVREAPLQRPQAVFLAHLIATASDAPQTRQRRRADPQDAAAAYGARAAAAAPAPASSRWC